MTTELELGPEEVRQRFAWARRKGHPRYLWPDVPIPTWRAALQRLEQVTGYVLSGDPASLEVTSGIQLRALGIAAFTSGLAGILGVWIERGDVNADDDVAALFRLHLRHARERAERAAIELVRVVDVLSAAGLGVLAVKSSHTSRVYFPEPAARTAADIDVVLLSRDGCEAADDAPKAAERALEAAGYVLTHRIWKHPHTEWLCPGSNPLPRSLELFHADSPYKVEVHRSLDRNYVVRGIEWGAIDSYLRVEPRLAAGVRVLREPLLLCHQLTHASRGLEHLTLIRLLEIALIVRADTALGQLDWAEILALLEAREAIALAWPALELTERLVPGTVPEDVLARARLEAHPALHRVIDDLRPADAQRPDVLSLVERFMWCSRPSHYVRRAMHSALPWSAVRSPRRIANVYRDRLFRAVGRSIELR